MLPRWLFRLAISVSAVLLLLVVVSPVLQARVAPANRWSRFLALFAQDATLRRTASAGAIGLIVTACVFFRQPAPPQRAAPKEPTTPPPRDMAGA